MEFCGTLLKDRPAKKTDLGWSKLAHAPLLQAWKGCQTTCKPGSVKDDHSSGTPVAKRLKRPARAARRKHHRGRNPLPPLFGLAPGGVCRAVPVAGNAVRSYRTLSPLLAGRTGGRSALCGTFPRVTSAGRYPAPCFRGARTFLPLANRGAAIQPSGTNIQRSRLSYVNRPRRPGQLLFLLARRSIASSSSRGSIPSGNSVRFRSLAEVPVARFSRKTIHAGALK